ncbi:MAG: hypothetical protein ABS35_06850 [Kaistia sp. SCN 65-12]|nr:MAG: hypothetical protein ABS35_06850 [Kaistia sp. SCN 65-12]
MIREDDIQAFSALGQSTRVDVLRLLAVNPSAGLPAGQIGEALGKPQNTISTHLAILARAGLVSAERRGRWIVYRAEISRIVDLAESLLGLAGSTKETVSGG